MTFWLEELERLRKEQNPEPSRPAVQLELPVALPKPPSNHEEPKRGVIIIGNDDEENEGVITI